MGERDVEGLTERLRRAIRLVEEWRISAGTASEHAKRLTEELGRMTTAKEWWRRAAWDAVGEEMPEVEGTKREFRQAAGRSVGVHAVEPVDRDDKPERVIAAEGYAMHLGHGCGCEGNVVCGHGQVCECQYIRAWERRKGGDS